MAKSSTVNRTFMKRTLSVIRGYKGSDEAANLINCLTGLLIVAPEAAFDRLPDAPLSEVRTWGINTRTVRKLGRCSCGNGHPQTLRQFVTMLRHAASRHEVRPVYRNGTCGGVEVRDGDGDGDGFHAVIKPTEMRRFVESLAEHLGEQRRGSGKFLASWQRPVFHLPNCKCARRISPANLEGIGSRQAALSAGHRPCKVCKP